jgi:hypothetical protein
MRYLAMSHRCILITAVLLLGACCSMTPPRTVATTTGLDGTCTITRPPQDAGVNSNHGLYFFVYPRTVPDNFTGCQTMWDENGSVWMKLSMMAGEIRTLKLRVPSDPPEESECTYSAGKLVSGPVDSCPDAGQLKRGLLPFGGIEEAGVPSDRDLRKRER